MVQAAIIAAGAILGALGGADAQKKRKEQAARDYGALVRKDARNEAAKKSYADILKGNITVGALQAGMANEAEAAKVAENAGALEANAGASGLSGGTPFFQLAAYASKAARQATRMASARALQVQGQAAQGGLAVNQYRDAGTEIGIATYDAGKQVNYLNSMGSSLMAVATGALSGATTAASIATTLTGMGIDLEAIGKAGVADPVKTGALNPADDPNYAPDLAIPEAPASPQDIPTGASALHSSVLELNSGRILGQQRPVSLLGTVPFSPDVKGDGKDSRFAPKGQEFTPDMSMFGYLKDPVSMNGSALNLESIFMGSVFDRETYVSPKTDAGDRMNSLFDAPNILLSF